MARPSRVFAAPAYLFACLILGGSAQGIWQNMALQLAGLGIIAWAALDRADAPLALAPKLLLLIAVLAMAVVALQTIPLPASVWTRLGPRHLIADGFAELGRNLPPQPLSVTP